MPKSETVFGVDIGGSGVKGAPVDIGAGELVGERVRVETPEPATPEAVAEVVADIVDSVGGSGRIGVTVPGVVTSGVVRTAANIDASWIGTDFAELLRKRHDIESVVMNDADAAGIAEMAHGAGRGQDGVVFMATLGTGIGTAVFVDGVLVPNTELGHIEMNGMAAEKAAAAKVRKREGLDWDDWAVRVDQYFHMIERLMWPDLIVVGGGVSKKIDEWFDHLTITTPIVAAELQNDAGIVGAAMRAAAQGEAAPPGTA